jgi:hypothetical protein
MNKTKIAAALRALADAIEETDVATETKPERKPAKKTPAPERPGSEESGDPVDDLSDDPPTEDEADQAGDSDDTVDEVTLEDLQELGASLLRAKKRDKFVAVLGDFGVKNLSAAKPADYKKLWTALTKAGE